MEGERRRRDDPGKESTRLKLVTHSLTVHFVETFFFLISSKEKSKARR